MIETEQNEWNVFTPPYRDRTAGDILKHFALNMDLSGELEPPLTLRATDKSGNLLVWDEKSRWDKLIEKSETKEDKPTQIKAEDCAGLSDIDLTKGLSSVPLVSKKCVDLAKK